MGQRQRTLGAALALLLTTASGAAVAANGDDIAHNGKGDAVPACSACHGEHGEGQPDAGFPRLAGLNAGYIVHELASFADKTRKNETMAPIASGLTGVDRQAVAAYFASLNPPVAASGTPPDKALIAAGGEIAQRGAWSKGVPACALCHGTAGLGVGATFPRLAGQSQTYIANQLDAWRKGERANDPLHLMAGVAGKLDDNQVKAVAAYYASLPPAVAAAASPAKGTVQ
jgi:cytochrome c553